MEADWELEMGGNAPTIDGCWPGFVDLRWTPDGDQDRRERLRRLPEAVQFSGLAAALERLNGEHSTVWTSKCDFWPALSLDEFDPDELDAPAESRAHALGCYIDLLRKSGRRRLGADEAAASCKSLCAELHAVPLRCCRVDVIIRHALIAPDWMDMGITAFFTACGPTAGEAEQTLESALAAFVDALQANSTLQ
jgi:hypothetical protein